ncbi:hypothetical protein N7476_001829 [Penicillium atrosanguineum]|uniref:GmrSD restriction endonucleases C-terminal domain-containing protein n=1 Tax=Penicillium atrosanguineum TaxID=1132637 RepID=A0A9W9Q2S1_9EURO|nr:hypothetical protein N7526_006332 [Penicillium atrosanguineum]KAJ5323229.1 hypothetical protein N7476_001829 [Penicillium atrosanguineum]
MMLAHWFGKILVLTTVQSVLVIGLPAPDLRPSPPGIPSLSTVKNELASLVVAVQGSQDGYSRAKFPHWITQSGSCNTRDVVLKRDGSDVDQDVKCETISGTWYSPYDGATWTDSSDLDIDHLVPLSNAWKSGAAAWTTADRKAFANDLTNPQLLAVTDNVNSAKGDSGPEQWMPPLDSYHCTYAEMWVKVKSVYNLTITINEKTALVEMLGSC